MDDFYPEMFDDFTTDFDADLNDDLASQIDHEPLDVTDLEDWDDELGLDDDF